MLDVTQGLAEAAVVASVGTTGDSYFSSATTDVVCKFAVSIDRRRWDDLVHAATHGQRRIERPYVGRRRCVMT